MSETRERASQLEIIIKSYTLKKETVKNQIMQVNHLITKKKLSLAKCIEYAETYKKNEETNILATALIMKNNQAFYEQLARVIQAERTELERLEKLKSDLVSNYRNYVNKIDGLSSVCEDIRNDYLSILDKREESNLSDLAISILAKECTWNR
jgi:3-methyladenine DNA glycosylase/8-oxoguanine DNA glycosylase